MQKVFRTLAILFLIVTAITLIALQIKPLGFIILGIGVIMTVLCEHAFRKHILLIYISLGLLGLTPISTDISVVHMISMGIALLLAVAIPYAVTHYLYKDHVIKFPWHHGRKWYTSEILYILITATIAYFFLPFMLRNSGAYTNWTVDPGVENLTRLFIGTNALGIWDELFFISTVLALLRKHLSFPVANFVQAVLFTSFLYELGFRGWSFIVICIFALIQGYIFKKTESLLYVITIHLIFDFILYLTLIYLYHPDWLPIFIT